MPTCRLSAAHRLLRTVATLCLASFPFVPSSAADLPPLPARDGAVEIPAQEWPLRPGPRQVRVLVHYPGGDLKNVTEKTGIMLTLHNWGGENCVGTASPQTLANELNVIGACVNYLQSGKADSIDGPEPYDYGYLQALDALRALRYIEQQLAALNRPYATGRIYATGGSGGGNVTLMANKLAPRTFAAVVDLCGMKKLTDDVAFNLPGGSDLDARYNRDQASPNYLSVDAQELRFVGNPLHLAEVRKLGPSAKIVIVHGTEDSTCSVADARELVANLQQAKYDVEPRFITKDDIDGKVFTSTGHSLGDRTQIVLKVAGKYLRPDSPEHLVRKGASDFERCEEIRFPTQNGAFVISYRDGAPVGRFERAATPPKYEDHQDLTYYIGAGGKKLPVKSVADWDVRRGQVLAAMQQVMGKLPSQMQRVPLDVKVLEEVKVGDLLRKKISYQTDANDRVAAYLFLPPSRGQPLPAILCLQQTTKNGKEEPAGIGGKPDLYYALHLAQRGYVTLAPDYPGFGEHIYDFAPERGYDSGSMKAIWDNIRSVDLLQTLPEVDAERIGCIGHSLGGHNTMFTAAFEPRIKALVASCGFTRFGKDDLPSWTGKVYMPRIASVFHNSVSEMPFDFPEIIGTFAPRPFFNSSAEGDSDFDASGVRDSFASALPIYQLYGKPENLVGYYPAGPHAFPADARERAYDFFDKHLKGK